MKLTMKLLFAFATLAFIACGESKKEKETAANDVKEELQDVVEVSKDYTSETMDDIYADMKKIQDNVNNEMAAVADGYNSLSDELKAKYMEEKAELENQQKKLENKIQEYEEVADDKKDDLKAEIKQIKSALVQSINTFQEEMANETKNESK